MAERAALPAAATRAVTARPALPPRRPPPSTAARRRSGLVCRAGRPPVPTLFDDLTAPSSSSGSGGGVNSFDDLLRQQMQAMERAQAELSAVSREMDARFAQAQQAAQQQGGRGGPCGYRWHSSVERSGPGRRGKGGPIGGTAKPSRLLAVLSCCAVPCLPAFGDLRLPLPDPPSPCCCRYCCRCCRRHVPRVPLRELHRHWGAAGGAPLRHGARAASCGPPGRIAVARARGGAGRCGACRGTPWKVLRVLA